jgi:hypothetical protein
MMLQGKVIAPTEDWIRERLGIPQADEDAQEYLDKQKEVVMSGLENIQKAQAALPGKDEDPDDKKDPKKKPEVDVKADPDDKKDAKKKEQIQKNNELDDLDDYFANLRSSVRGILKVGITGEE